MAASAGDARELKHRDAELAVLTESYRRLIDLHRTGVVAVRGDGGIGKTAIIRGFASKLASRPEPQSQRVGYGAAGHAGEGYGPIRWALRDILNQERHRGRDRAKRLAELIWTVAPEWLGIIPGIGGILRAVAFTADKVMRPVVPGPAATLADQFIDLAREMSQEKPLVLLLDDLHWADRATAGLVFDLARMGEEEHVPILIVASYRSPGGGGNLPIERALRDLQRYVQVELLTVGPLERSGIIAIAEEVAGCVPPPTLVDWLERRTGSNPLFARELLRTLLENHTLDPLNWSHSTTQDTLNKIDSDHVPIPATVEAILGARLDGLTAHESQIIKAAAILGEPVRPADLVVASGSSPTLVEECLRRLCQDAGLLLSDLDSADASYRFAFNLLPDLLTRRLLIDRYDYQNHHRRVAELIEARSTPTAADWETLARHWYEAGDTVCALATVHRFARNAYRDGKGRAAALALAERVQGWIAKVPDPATIAHAEILVAHAWVNLQYFSTAVEKIEHVTSLLSESSNDFVLACSLVLRASIESRENTEYGRFELAIQASGLLKRIPAGSQNPVVTAYQHDWLLRALVTASWVAIRRAEWHHVDQVLNSASKYVSEPTVLGFWSWSGAIAQCRGESLAQRGRWSEAIPPLEDALCMAKSENHITGVCAAQGWLGLARCYAGDVPKGLADVRAALTCERDVLHSAEGAAKWLHLVGEFYASRSEWSRAAELFWFARDLLRELGHARAIHTDEALGHVRLSVGDDEFERMHLAFDPRDSEWAIYAMRWGVERFLAYPGNPILSRSSSFISLADPTTWSDNRAVWMLYRSTTMEPNPAPGANGSEFRLVSSPDGYSFNRWANRPVRFDSDTGVAVERWKAARLQRLANEFVLTYAEIDTAMAHISIARTGDLLLWRTAGVAISEDQWNRCRPDKPTSVFPAMSQTTAVLLPEPVDDRWWMYFGDRHIWAAWTEDPDLRHWDIIRRPILSPRQGSFDSILLRPGPAPVRTQDGFLLLYNAVDDDAGCSVGQALLSASDPTMLIRRSSDPLLTICSPDDQVRDQSLMGNASGLVRWSDKWFLYYDIGDSNICVATTREHKLVG